MTAYEVRRFSGKALPTQYFNYLMSSWKRSLRYGNDFFKLADANAFYDYYDRYIRHLLSSPASAIRLALLADDTDVVLGFSVCRGNVLDYVYVHKDYRRIGVGTVLVPDNCNVVTHLTKTGLTIFGAKHRWTFNPFA